MSDDYDQKDDDELPLPDALFVHSIQTPNGEEVRVEVFDNGTIATEVVAKAGGWGGGGGGGTRTCSGRCGAGPTLTVTCPIGSSPVLDCRTGNGTLTCRPTSAGGIGTAVKSE